MKIVNSIYLLYSFSFQLNSKQESYNSEINSYYDIKKKKINFFSVSNLKINL